MQHTMCSGQKCAVVSGGIRVRRKRPTVICLSDSPDREVLRVQIKKREFNKRKCTLEKSHTDRDVVRAMENKESEAKKHTGKKSPDRE